MPRSSKITDAQIRKMLLRVVTQRGGDVSFSSLSQHMPEISLAGRNAAVDRLVSDGLLRKATDSRKPSGGKPQIRVMLALTPVEMMMAWPPCRQSFTEMRVCK